MRTDIQAATANVTLPLHRRVTLGHICLPNRGGLQMWEEVGWIGLGLVLATGLIWSAGAMSEIFPIGPAW